MLQRGHSGDGCDLASNLWKYDLREGATSEGGSISSELLMCGGCVRSILLLPVLVRCIETIDVCIWRMFGLVSVVVIAWGFIIVVESVFALELLELAYHCRYVIIYFNQLINVT